MVIFHSYFSLPEGMYEVFFGGVAKSWMTILGNIIIEYESSRIGYKWNIKVILMGC